MKDVENENRENLLEGLNEIGEGWKGDRHEIILRQVESLGIG